MRASYVVSSATGRFFTAFASAIAFVLAFAIPTASAQSASQECGEPGNRFVRFVGGSYVVRSKFCEVERQLFEQRDATREAEIRAGGLISERDLSRARVAELEAQLEAAGACRAPELEASLDAMRMENLDLLDSQDNLTSQIAGLDLQIEQLRDTINAQQTQLDDAFLDDQGQVSEIVRLTAALKASNTEALAIRTERDNLQAGYEALGLKSREDASRLGAELESTTQTLSQCLKDFEGYRTTVSDSAAVSGDVEAQMALAKADAMDMEAKLTAAREEIATLKLEMDQRQAAARMAQQTLRADLAQAQQTITDRDTMLEDLRAQMDRVNVERDAQVAALQAQLADLDMLDALRAMSAKQASDLARAQEAMATTLASKASLEGRLRDAQESLGATQTKLEKASGELKLIRVNLANGPKPFEQLEALKAQLEAARAGQHANGELSAKLAAAQSEIEVLRGAVKNATVMPRDSSSTLNSALRLWMERSRGNDENGLFLHDDRLVLSSGASLFQPGSARLSAEGNKLLASMAEELKTEIAALPEGEDWQLDVLGHADATPAGNRWPSNWELSAFRAATVVRTLVDAGLPPSQLSAVGLGEFHPLIDEATPEAYAKNRRIELQFR